MKNLCKLAVVSFALFVIFAPTLALAADGVPAAATEEAAEVAKGVDFGLGKAFAAIGAGLVIIGGGFGIARIGANTVESMARQPEIAGTIQTAMIISAALIEGVTFFALIICMMCR